MLMERLYPYAPVWLQNLGISIYGLSFRHERLGGEFREYVQEFRERDNWTRPQMTAYVEDRLRTILLHAFDHIPYYRAAWNAAGITGKDISVLSLADLPRLPITPKQDLRRDPNAFTARNIPERQLRRYYTSGSTGTPVTCICTPDAHRRFIAAREVRSFGWAKTTLLGSRSMMGGRLVVPRADSKGPYYRYNRAERQVYFSSFHISPDRVPNYVDGLNRYRPRVLTGYASAHYLLARRMIQQNLRLEYQPDALILSSEKLTGEMKAWIDRAFNARAYQEYGSVENCALATECEYGSLHVSPDFGIVEIVNEAGLPVAEGTEGRLVCTGLLNSAQPLIRYDIGDQGVWAKSRCQCGRDQFPVLQEIVGRLEDVVIGLDGREMVRFHGVFINLPHVLEAQIIQESRNLIRVRVVSTEEFGEKEETLIRERITRGRLGPVYVRIERTAALERTERGKVRGVISRLSNEK
ncbi:putative capsular polysaccharide biosynthesis protein [Candidatus Sulfopaludibacter sp. SbA4]|nr:putative capsular polysaccharide biosynthesis protein [Candidatus Sulfopaludibacter sp. SbA4]